MTVPINCLKQFILEILCFKAVLKSKLLIFYGISKVSFIRKPKCSYLKKIKKKRYFLFLHKYMEFFRDNENADLTAKLAAF